MVSTPQLPNGFSRYLASKYIWHAATIRKVLARAKDQGVAEGNMNVAVSSLKKGKLGTIRSHSNVIKPVLTEANEYTPLKFAMSFVRPDMQFNELLNYVHIDEKWFYLTKTARTYYLVHGRVSPNAM
ncbi:hypothetical protein H310_14705 [Aphanomyces invadans]|uniref:Uncharacterized protein n=1 Tax=Aphanomyces invadans TaxID=157072 RepID=A0A024T8P7_9STRA|nr:hypothetical protein H310_14705 [Aphanomyces invadans]ETV90515.1 hypothetical protein H310_14705 [Aphanomyces invadans]|eukprot:XP_008880831.1 hypothetical protein H310_14705 [Aphanomyces invadans]